MIDKYYDAYFLQHSTEEKNKILSIKQEYESLPQEQKMGLSFFSIMSFDKIFQERAVKALNFFVGEEVKLSSDGRIFEVYPTDEDKKSAIGYIYHKNYETVVDLILQRVGVERSNADLDNVKIKNKAAAKIFEKIKIGETRHKTKSVSDNKMSLGNIISSLAIHSNSLNISNIWDLTVYQLYDQFRKQQIDDSYKIGSSHVAAWGDSKNKFDSGLWFTPLQTITNGA